MARHWRWLVVLGMLPMVTFADELELRRGELDQVRARIEAVERVLARVEAERSEAAAQLARAEREVSAAARQLTETREQLAATAATLVESEREAESVAARIAERHEELAAWLRRQYTHGGNEVAPLLAARDPNQLARDLHYLEHLGRARLALIEGLRSDLDRQQRVLSEIAAERDRLALLEREQLARQADLDRRRAARATAAEGLAAQMQAQRREVDALRRDEAQLGEIVTALAAAAAAREAARRQMAARAAAQPPAVPPEETSGAQPPASPSPRSAEPVRGVARETAAPTPPGVRFSQLRGRVGYPVRGELIGRFGAPRAEGGARWRGVFIRATPGEQVVAVAPGEVVFSDWLRGYGNLLIIEHDDDYLTIYGNNDELLRGVGDRISAGMPIASVGASGSGQDSGLYFEIRHRGEPVDPMQWLRAR